MTYVDRVLLDGERIERRPRLSVMAVFGAPSVEFVLAAGAWSVLRWVVIGPLLTSEDPQLNQLMFWGYVAGMALFAARYLARMARRAVQLAFHEIAVTNRRFMEKAGVFSIRFYSTDLEKIVRVAIEQSLLGRIFDYGHVTIVTIGEVSHTTTDIAAPIRLQQALHARMTAEDRSVAPEASRPDEGALLRPVAE